MRDPDLQILIQEDHSGARASLRFMLKARDPGLGLNFEPFGPVSLLAEPRQHFEEVFKEIVALPLHDGEARADAQVKLEAKGASLAKALLPPGLRDLLWELQGKIESVAIQSDEGWIPWELLKLRKREKGGWASGSFLCEAFALTRWRPGVAEHLHLPLKSLALVTPGDADLPATLEESDFIESLQGSRRTISKLSPRYRTVIDAMATGRFDGWHFSGHGLVRAQDPNLWSILLDEGDELKPEDLNGEAANLGLAHPLVFLNACHSGREALSLTHVGGWAAQLLDAGAGAFVGASWATRDEPAKDFAVAFYREFLQNVPIGEAVRRARLEIRERFPGDPTWLAYVAYAHPLARCEEPSEDRPRLRSEVPSRETSVHRPPSRTRNFLQLRRSMPRKHLTKILAALLGTLAIVVATLVAPSWSRELLVRVSDARSAGVRGAEVLLFAEGGPYRSTTDTHGAARLSLPGSGRLAGRLVVQSADYEIWERDFPSLPDEHVDVRLAVRKADFGKVLFRVVDGSTGEPVPNAEVQLLEGAEVYSQTSDASGLVRFDADFQDGKAEVRITVKAVPHTFKHQYLTLRPDTSQDIALNRHGQTLELSPLGSR
jgi:hypothetical protein